MAKPSAEERQRVAAFLLSKMSDLGWDETRLIEESRRDRATIISLLAGTTWPQRPTREAVEKALGIQPGAIERARRAKGEVTGEPEGDAVEDAIRRSALTRANQHTLIGTYYGMLDQQQERGAS